MALRGPEKAGEARRRTGVYYWGPEGTSALWVGLRDEAEAWLSLKPEFTIPDMKYLSEVLSDLGYSSIGSVVIEGGMALLMRLGRVRE